MTTKRKNGIASERSEVIKTTGKKATGNSKQSKSNKSSNKPTPHTNNFNNQFSSTISDAVKFANTNPNRVEKKKNVEKDGHGRLKGQKNLIPVRDGSGKIVAKTNKHGVTFTTEEQKKLNQAVDRFYKKRKTIHTREVAIFLGYDMEGQLSGKKDRFLTDEFSKGLHQFKTRDSYDRVMAQLEEYNSASYINDIVNDYKNRLVKTIANTGTLQGHELEKVTKTISRMSQKDFALRFGNGFFGTLTEYYKNQVEEDEQKKLFEEHGIESSNAVLGRSANLTDLMKKLGKGEDALEVDKENNAFAVAKRAMREDRQRKQNKKAKERARNERQRDEKLAQRESEYQKMLKLTGATDNKQMRELFFGDLLK